MATMGFQPDDLHELEWALRVWSWPWIEQRYARVLKLLRSDENSAALVAASQEAYQRLHKLAHKLAQHMAEIGEPEATVDPLPESLGDLQSALAQLRAKLDALVMATIAPRQEVRSAIELYQEVRGAFEVYQDAQNAFALYVGERGRSLDEAYATPAAIFGERNPTLQLQQGVGLMSDEGGAIPLPEPALWELLGRSLSIEGVKGTLFIGGDISDETIQTVERLLAGVVEAAELSVEWGASRRGSWWRRFKTAAGMRFYESDLDTLKRAAEVQILDRHESESAKNYAEALASLAQAVSAQGHAYLMAKNVILLKTVDDLGNSVTVGRVLTSREVALYQAGQLDIILSHPQTALKFIRSGSLPVGELPSAESDATD